MDLQSPSLIAATWLLLPLFLVVASLALGVGVRLVSGLEMGVLTAPAGFVTGMTAMAALLVIGVSGKVTVVLTLLLCVAGPLWMATRKGAIERARQWRPGRTLLWGTAAGLAAWAMGMAPVAGSGRIGILGYVFNNDPSIHISLVQALYAHGAQAMHSNVDSFLKTSELFTTGYPLGSYGWFLVPRTIFGVDPFYIWSPYVAVAMGMLALVLFDLLRSLRAPLWLAAAGGALAATGHLVFAYHVQGGAKEVFMPVAVYGAIALGARAMQRQLTLRALLPAAFAAAATVADLGYAGLAWIGPAGLVALGVLFWRAMRRRSAGELRSAVVFVVVGAVVALPAIVTSIHFYNSARGDITDPKEVGNLLGPVSVFQALNVWPAQDYRFPHPDHLVLSDIGMAIAGALAILGLVYAIAKGNLGIVMSAVAAVVAVVLIAPRASIYYDAKTYVVLAPAVGLAVAAGVAALLRVGPPGWVLAALAGGAVAFGMLASNWVTYGGVWFTPKERFEQMSQIADRFAGQGPMLISEREQYGAYFMRRSQPWNDWGYRQLVDYPHVRFPADVTPPPPRNPDLDDYPIEHVEAYNLLLDRKGPGSSLPPSNYRLVYETSFYRVWQKDGPAPREHVPFGTDGLQGLGPVQCRAGQPTRPALKRVVSHAEAAHSQLAVSLGGANPRILLSGFNWLKLTRGGVEPPFNQSAGYGGIASTIVRVKPGRYTAWIQGSYGPGVRATVASATGSRVLGEVHADLGQSDGWFPLGTVDLAGRTNATMIGLTPNRLIAGSHHFNLNGNFAITPAAAASHVVRVDPRRIGSLCGHEVDWVELPAAA